MKPRHHQQARPLIVEPDCIVEIDSLWHGTACAAAVRPVAAEAVDEMIGRVALRTALLAMGGTPGVTAAPGSDSHPCSVSSSDGRAAAVVHRDPDRRVGVDLARSGSVPPRLASWFVTPEERRRCPFGDPTVLRTLKEAAWKAEDREALPLHQIEIVFTPRGHVRGVRVAGRETPAQVVVLLPWPGWILSVVCLEDAA